jgi:hypothetical protein
MCLINVPCESLTTPHCPESGCWNYINCFKSPRKKSSIDKLNALYLGEKFVKPDRSDIHELVRIFQKERYSWLDQQSIARLGEYFGSVLVEHVKSIPEMIKTEEDFDMLLRKHLGMSFDDWYNSL